MLKTVEGEDLTVEIKGGSDLGAGDAKGSTANHYRDVMQSNGVIHVIDTVLLPS